MEQVLMRVLVTVFNRVRALKPTTSACKNIYLFC